jgi:hypothetical protein
MNREVVDLITLYNFCKGRIVFLHKLQPNFVCRHVSVNRSCWQLTKFFTSFPSNLKCQST